MSCEINWGTVPTWISAIATVGGFLWVIIIFRVEMRWRRLATATPLLVTFNHEDSKIELQNVGVLPFRNIEIYVADEPLIALEALAPGSGRSFTYDSDSTDDSTVLIDYDDTEGQNWHKRVGKRPKATRRFRGSIRSALVSFRRDLVWWISAKIHWRTRSSESGKSQKG